MSRKLTHKCDGCGVEHVDDGEPIGIAGILGAGRTRGTDNWGSLSVGTPGFPAMFDLCEACTKRVVALLELEVPDTREYEQRFGIAGLGHAVPFMPGDRMAPPFMRSVPPSPLTPEDLRALGLSSACANCGVAFKGSAQGPCPMCGHVN